LAILPANPFGVKEKSPIFSADPKKKEDKDLGQDNGELN